MSRAQTIDLTEYKTQSFTRNEIDDVGEILWRKYNKYVSVEFPSPKTSHKWQLTAQGWVGYIPLTPEVCLKLQPKVEITNLFRMLEYAYKLEIDFPKGLNECKSLEEFYERLAHVLARRILNRGRKGFYRAYVPRTTQLPYIRGRLDVRQSIQKPWDVKLRCHYEEHTADIEENQILVWTLFIIARSGLCTERVLPLVRQAYHTLQRLVTLQSNRPEDCVGRRYNRLNEDYRPLHALCQFFLENSGPSHNKGDRSMLPFLINMARLYELFVSHWLRTHLPQDFKPPQVQERVYLDQGKTLYFDIDIVLYDAVTDTALYVLDTKYKIPSKPAADDISQVVSYAVALGCSEAVLVYPKPLDRPLDTKINDIRVRSLTFSLDGNLDKAGNKFLLDLLPSCPVNANS